MNAVATVPSHSIRDMQEMANAISDSRLFGKITPAQAFALMLIAQAEGRHPATVAQEYDIIQDRPALKSVAALSRFQRAGGTVQWLQRTDMVAEAQFSHERGGNLVVTWTMERANKAQLTGKDNWKKFPAQMLSARVVAEGVRAVLPVCLNGCYLVEEVQDFDAPVAPPRSVQRPPAKMEVSQAPPIALADPAERDSLLAELIANGATRMQIGEAVRGTKKEDFTEEHMTALDMLLGSILARLEGDGATESSTDAEAQ